MTLRNHYEALFHPVFVLFGSIIVLSYFFYQYGYHSSFIIGFVIWYAIFEGTGLYLHLEYYLRNRGEAYTVTIDGLLRKKDGRTEMFKTKEIKKIVVYMSPNMYKKWPIFFFAMEQYHYARIFLNNGEILYVTCLLTPCVNNVFSDLKGVQVKKKKWPFNSTYFSESWY